MEIVLEKWSHNKIWRFSKKLRDYQMEKDGDVSEKWSDNQIEKR